MGQPRSNIEEVSNMLGVNLLGKLPLNPACAEAADKGEFYSIDNTELEVAKEILERIQYINHLSLNIYLLV